jgi:lipopolysaccharide export system ATP-binding protein
VKKRKVVKKPVKKVSDVDSLALEVQKIQPLIIDSVGSKNNNDTAINLHAINSLSAELETGSNGAAKASAPENHDGATQVQLDDSSSAEAMQQPVAPRINESVVVHTSIVAPTHSPIVSDEAAVLQSARSKAQALQNISVLGAENLRKSYRKRTVVNNISLEIKQNEIVGLLGPNGAGKTTVFYMIVGLEKPDKGKIYLDAKDISRLPMYLRARNGISYLPQEASVFRKLTVEENILLVLQTMPLSKREREYKLESLLDELDIEYVRHTKAYQLSGGERRRTEIARCLVIEPRFILLDEPFAGIDPIAVIDIQRILQKLCEKGIGVLITDHNVRETLAITDRAYIINEGQIFRAGTPEALTQDEEVKRVYLGENFRM